MSKGILKLKIKELTTEILSSYMETLSRIFNSDGELMSTEAQNILSNPDDKKIYLEALEDLKKRRSNGEEMPEKKITLSSGDEITLTTY